MKQRGETDAHWRQRLKTERDERAKRKEWRRTPIRVAFSWLNQVLLIAAALSAILGVIFWLSEGRDRDEERENRRGTLVGAAFSSIETLAADTAHQIKPTPHLQWAIRTLAERGEPIRITHPNIDLSNMDLSCATIDLRGATIDLSNTKLDDTSLDIATRTGDLTDLYVRNSTIRITGMKPTDSKWSGLANIQFTGNTWGSVLEIEAEGHIAINAERTILNQGDADLRFERYNFEGRAPLMVEAPDIGWMIVGDKMIETLPPIFGPGDGNRRTDFIMNRRVDRSVSAEWQARCPDGECPINSKKRVYLPKDAKCRRFNTGYLRHVDETRFDRRPFNEFDWEAAH